MPSAKYSFFAEPNSTVPIFIVNGGLFFASVYDNLEAKRHVALNFF